MYPRPGVSLVPTALKAMINQRVPSWLSSYWPESPALLSEIGPEVWDVLSEVRIERLGAMIIAIAVSEARSWYDVPIPILKIGNPGRLDGLLNTRTKNLLMRAVQLDLDVRCVGDLMRVRNFGAATLLDYLSFLDAVIGGIIRIAAPDDDLDGVVHPPANVHVPAAPLLTRRQAGHPPGIGLLLMLASFSSRDCLVLRERTLSLQPKTLQDVAQLLGVTRERVRQVENKIVRTLFAMLQLPGNCQVAEAIAILGLKVPHEVCSILALEKAVRYAFALPPSCNTVDIFTATARLLLGFTTADEFFAYRSAPDELWRTVLAALSSGYLQAHEASFLQHTASALDVPPEFVEHVRSTLDLRPVKGILLPWAGSLADKAERILTDIGQPLDVEDLYRALDISGSSNTLRNYFISDPRFQRVARTRIALTAWGLEEYSSIREVIRRRIRAAGGKVLAQTLLEDLPRQFDVAESSVRSYIYNRNFKVDGLGFVAESDEPWDTSSAHADPSRNRFLFRHGKTWYLRTTLNSDLLRGSGRVIPVAAAPQLGLTPGTSTERIIDDRIIRFAWTTESPTIGSVRNLIEYHNATLGDLLFISLLPYGESGTSFTTRMPPTTDDGLESLYALVGLTSPPSDSIDAIKELSGAIGISSNNPSLDVLRLYFGERRDSEALQLLPTSDSVRPRATSSSGLLAMLDR
jgi:transcriptional regulator with XRE-family HTH domain